jgi:hypothetical protein
MKLKELLADCILLAGIVIATLTISYWLAGYCTAADCINCDAGLVGRGPVKYVCPICDGSGELAEPSTHYAFAEHSSAIVPPFSRAGATSGNAANHTARDHRQAVVRIVVSDGPSTSRGSGVLVTVNGKPLVLTAYHVVRTSRSANIPTVYFQDGIQSKAKVIKTDDAFDLAVLECEKVSPVAARLAAGEPTGTLTVAGYGPHPSKFRESAGRIVGRARPSRQHPMDHIVISTPARQGDSGGPVFNEAGEVAGILWGSEGRNTYATHAGRIQTWLATPEAEFVACDQQVNGPNKLDGCPDGRCRK